MKNIFLLSFVLICFFSCKKDKEIIDHKPKTFYLNKDSIEIIEFSDKKITRYFFRKNLLENITADKIKFNGKNKNSLILKQNPDLIYKWVQIDTNYTFNLKSSQYWTHKLKGKFQMWYTFYNDTMIDNTTGEKTYFNAYTGYYSDPSLKDTVLTGNCSYRELTRFKKFNAFDFGSYCSAIGLVSKYNDDTLSVIPIIPLNEVNNKKYDLFYFTKYHSKKSDLHLGDWKLTNSSQCDIFEYYGGNKLKITKDSIIFSNNEEILTSANYTLGLDSNFLQLYQEGYDLYFSDIKILENNSNTLKLRLKYYGGFCKSNEILIYTRM